MTKNDKRRFGLISREERKGCSSSTVLFFVLYCCICCVLLGAHRTSKIVDWFNRFWFAAVVVEGSDDVDL